MDSFDPHGCTREAVDVLESRIASAAHAAHDVIELHLVNQIDAGSTRGGEFRSYFLLDLQKAINNMEFVKRKAMQFKEKGGLMAEQPTYSSSSSSSSAATSSQPLKNNVMVGFDEVVLRLMEILTGEPSDQRLVIPIVGMGGSGKTSLVKTVYEHSIVKDHFDVHLWATISQQYSAETILAQLLYGENGSTTGGDVSGLGEVLRKQKLWDRRYLVVLDDMWSLKAWDEIQMSLPNNGNGSRVVVTTRLSNLAARLSSSPFELRLLDEDKSWELFCGKTFGEEDCPGELEEIGKKIVKRCGGLPLSIVVMGGHLRRSSRAIEYSEKVAGYMNPISSIGEEEQCLEILGLSYQHLPAYLKPCFLYLGIFKEDESILCSDIIVRWIEEGWLKLKRGLTLQELGEDCLRDLMDRNLILVYKRSWNGKVKRCKIHDSVREVCLKVSKKEKFLCEADDGTTQVTSRKERHIVIPKVEKFNSDMICAKQIFAPPVPLFDWSLVGLIELQLNSDGTYYESPHFPKLNLRAHEIYRYRLQAIYSVLSSMSACWNLQTLCIKTTYYNEPMTLPYEIWEMPHLRILHAHAVLLTDPASEQKECIVLQNLQALIGVVNLRLTEEVCKRMPNLKSLSVVYDRFGDDYCFQNLVCLNKLESLSITFGNDDPRGYDAVMSLKFPTSLEDLYFHNNCQLGWEDLMMMISSLLPHLRFLHVTQVRASEWNLDEEEFCCLKFLHIHGCDDLIHWKANSSHFPVLEFLILSSMPKFSEVPLDIGEIPTLKCIELKECSASAAISAVRMVAEQETYGNYDLQLYVGFFQDEELKRFQEMMQQERLATNSLHLYYKYEKITF